MTIVLNHLSDDELRERRAQLAHHRDRCCAVRENCYATDEIHTIDWLLGERQSGGSDG